jgi:hypothetical protein
MLKVHDVDQGDGRLRQTNALILVCLIALIFAAGAVRSQTFQATGHVTLNSLPAKTNPDSPTASDSVPTGCQLLYNEGYSYGTNREFQKEYDTLKKFIEACPLWPQSWRAFQEMLSAVPYDSASFARFRNWLESVLYLNTVDPEYFCQDVYTIAGTFYTGHDTTMQLRSKGTNTPLAVYQWLLEHTDCDTQGLRYDYNSGRGEQYYNWLQDSTAYKLDTTLPSMHDLGLDSLLNIYLQMQGVSKPAVFPNILESVTLSENPFRINSTLKFELTQMTYVRTEVYDELGRMVFGDGSGEVFGVGQHVIPLDLGGFPSGAYYLRISLADGEVRTLKMVKKE